MMKFVRALIGLVAFLIAPSAWAQVCPAGSTCTPLETYIYGTSAATAPYAASLFIPAIPSSSGSSALHIPANAFPALSGGVLQATNFPALSGDCTTPGGSLSITCLKTNGTAFTVLATTAPGTGVATALTNNINASGGVCTVGGTGCASPTGVHRTATVGWIAGVNPNNALEIVFPDNATLVSIVG